MTRAEQCPIRLAYLVSEYPAVSHTFILREVRRLREMNCEISVASINPPREPASNMTAEERAESAATFYVKRQGSSAALRAHLATVIRTPAAYLRALWFALRLGGADPARMLFAFFYFVEAIIVGHWMRSRRLAHLHVHFATPAASVGLIASRAFPIGFSFTVHGPDEFYDAPGYCLAQKIAGAVFVCCISHFARSQLMNLSPPAQWPKFELARLGVDTAAFAPPPFRSAAGVFEILCVGRLVPSKGQHILLDALDRLVKAGRNVRLRIVGDGPDRESLASEVRCRGLRHRVIFEGNVNQDRIAALYSGANAFALASFAEGLPVVLMEAMAAGLPCVSTFVAGIPELIRNEIDGLLVAPSDARALAGAFERLIDDPELRERLAANGRRRVVEHYDLDRSVARLARIFAGHIGHRFASENQQPQAMANTASGAEPQPPRSP